MIRLLLVSGFAVLAFAPSAQAQDPAKVGRAILVHFCAPCHSINRAGDSPLRGAPPFRTLSRSFELDSFAQDLTRGILAGHPGMPEFKFSDDDARAVAVYMRSIQR